MLIIISMYNMLLYHVHGKAAGTDKVYTVHVYRKQLY